MSAFWLGLLLLVMPTLAWAQNLDGLEGFAQESEPDQVQAPLEYAPGATAFTLTIRAADEVRALLEKHLELQRYRNLPDLSDDELRRLLAQTPANIEDLLGTLGYFAPHIRLTLGAPGVTPASAEPHRVVTIDVEAGPPALVSDVTLRFAGAIAGDDQAQAQRQDIRQRWLLPAGQRFSQDAWDAAKQQALRLLTDQRYPTGRISASAAEADPQNQTVRLSLTLDSGPAFRLGPLQTTGLQRFDNVLAQRLARLTEGADYSLKALVQAQRRLTDSGFFTSAFMRIDTRDGVDPQAAPVLLTVRESRLQKLVLGAGASTDSGARLSAEHLHHQVPGLGWRAATQVLLDGKEQSLGTEWTAPPDARGWRWNSSVLLKNQELGDLRTHSRRWRGGLGKNTERLDRSAFVQYDRAASAQTDGRVTEPAESLSLNYGATLRAFDDLPFPSRGWALGVELGLGATLGRDATPFGRIVGRWQAIWPLDAAPSGPAATPDAERRLGRLNLRARAGAVLIRPGQQLPATQLFLAGGDNSVRGYGLDDIGVTLADGNVSAGRYLGVASVEWQRPLVMQGRLSDWESTLFLDAGAVANAVSQLRARLGVGAGLRWRSPVGPLQADLAYGVDAKKLRLHLNVGFSF